MCLASKDGDKTHGKDGTIGMIMHEDNRGKMDTSGNSINIYSFFNASREKCRVGL